MSWNPNFKTGNLSIYENRVNSIIDVFNAIYKDKVYELHEYSQVYISQYSNSDEELNKNYYIIMKKYDDEIINKLKEVKEILYKDLEELYSRVYSIYSSYSRDILIELKLQSVVNYAGRTEFVIYLFDKLKEVIGNELNVKIK